MNLIQQLNHQTMNGKTADTFATLRPGATVRVHQKIKEGDKFRIQVFEGMIIARKHGTGPNATITVRKLSNGIGVERIFPIHTPMVSQFEVMKNSKVRRAKLYYLRTKTARETRRKTKTIALKTTPKSPSATPETPEVASE